MEFGFQPRMVGGVFRSLAMTAKRDDRVVHCHYNNELEVVGSGNGQFCSCLQNTTPPNVGKQRTQECTMLDCQEIVAAQQLYDDERCCFEVEDLHSSSRTAIHIALCYSDYLQWVPEAGFTFQRYGHPMVDGGQTHNDGSATLVTPELVLLSYSQCCLVFRPNASDDQLLPSSTFHLKCGASMPRLTIRV
eukprot:scaffold11725_cov116-Cylindrotheca_fusiformis.AAC.5